MPRVTVPYHHKDETLEEGKPIEIVFDVSGDLTPHVPAKLSGPPEDCYPAEGGTFEITEVKPVRYYLAGEEQHDNNFSRYRGLTGFEGAWEDLVDDDYCGEVAFEEHDQHLEREREECENFQEETRMNMLRERC